MLLCAGRIRDLFIYRVTYACTCLLAFSEGFVPTSNLVLFYSLFSYIWSVLTGFVRSLRRVVHTSATEYLQQGSNTRTSVTRTYRLSVCVASPALYALRMNPEPGPAETYNPLTPHSPTPFPSPEDMTPTRLKSLTIARESHLPATVLTCKPCVAEMTLKLSDAGC